MGPGVVYLGQELIYAMGNATATTTLQGTSSMNANSQPYGVHLASSPYISMDALIHNFDLLTYCKDTDGGRDAGADMVLWGCFLTLASQALIVMALNGEKSRVSVHDLHEQHNLFQMTKQLGTQATGAFEHMPLLAKQMSQEAQQAMHNPRDFANHMFGEATDQALLQVLHLPTVLQQRHHTATSAALSHPAAQAAAAATAASLGVSTSHPAAQAAAAQAHAAATKAEAGFASLAVPASSMAASAASHPAVQAAAAAATAAMSDPAAAASAVNSNITAASAGATKAAADAMGGLAHISHTAGSSDDSKTHRSAALPGELVDELLEQRLTTMLGLARG
eukprot:CAMPEP_0115747644 /NCGR_PEP_ID=MMETSP0272-20121206/93267_1 /TAXON_ID=71861 /ORGANISM="Scrippsiella trochoidea, Strain CCMP3099" /LENGTH=336 /DNA_ID=CAMNT_0003192639 /DNA_START=432 /DNA_END=1441 /DNA_ORIENTATION=+